MLLATSEEQVLGAALGAQESPLPSRAHGYGHPAEVLKDRSLTLEQKREILCAWMSDASAVQDEPTLRWLLGTPSPVPLSDIREALEALDGQTLQ